MSKKTASARTQNPEPFALRLAFRRFFGFDNDEAPTDEMEVARPAVEKAIEEMLSDQSGGWGSIVEHAIAELDRDQGGIEKQLKTLRAAGGDQLYDVLYSCAAKACIAGVMAGWRLRELMSEGGVR